MQFFLARDNQKCGPYTLEQLPAEGLSADSLVWQAGITGWTRAADVEVLQPLLATLPMPFRPTVTSAIPTPKSAALPIAGHPTTAEGIPPSSAECDARIDGEWERVKRLARWHTRFHNVIAFSILVVIAAAVALGSDGVQLAESYFYAYATVAWIAVVACMVSGVRAMNRYRAPWLILSFVPVVGLLTLAVFDQIATGKIKRAGGYIGFLGAWVPPVPPPHFTDIQSL